ncbi:MAG TPA: hypothetical protein VGI45_27525 [Terracidiphilus sp.]
MLTKATRRAFSACTALVVFGTTLSITTASQAQSQQEHFGLIGAWSVTVNLHAPGNCNGPAIAPPFSSIVMFSRGGTVTESTSNPAFEPGQRGTGLGVWWLNDNGTYSATDVAYVLFTSSNYLPGPPPLGFAAGTQEITHTITLNRHATQWTDSAIVQFYDVNHNALNHACATATAVRL